MKSEKLHTSEKLKSRKQIELLFQKGSAVKAYPLLLMYQVPDEPIKSAKIQVGFSVSKKRFKRAVDRNRIKRLMREVYRLNQDQLKSNLEQPLLLMLIYIGREEISFQELETKFLKGTERLLQELTNSM